MLGEYDFSKEKLQDTAGIKPPTLTPLNRPRFWGLPDCIISFRRNELRKLLRNFTYLCPNLTRIPESSEAHSRCTGDEGWQPQTKKAEVDQNRQHKKK
jgi:hypothetical protein